MESITNPKTTLCPSARQDWKGSFIFGVIGGTVEEPNVNYLEKNQPITEELIELSAPVTPTEIFRIAAPCANGNCQNFDGKNCRLAQRVIEHLPEVVEDLPACTIRQNCRWWQQEGKAACMRCPQVITDNYSPSELIQKVAI